MIPQVSIVAFALMSAVALALTGFWIWMLIDCARRLGGGERQQLGWLVAIALTHFLGAILYFFIGRRAQIHSA
jgi:hypothetical protein